ncbi:hypothetical protein [Variovorax sp. E3]|uniref:hypothetical protein n=1 Tax=Variovorax sp. E3 TaxID=1914993 RepID=UPI0022B6C9CB|nr:hypothetical protein [Variovorax sp. E3]
MPFLLPGAAGSVTLTGTATYESVPNPNGGLVYASTSLKPVRGAALEVVDAASSAQLAVATTDDSGAYSVTVPANSTVFVRVRAQLTRAAPGPAWDVSVRDNTQAGALYSMQTSAFSSGTTASTHDLRAATGWDGAKYGGPRVAAPFAILDTVYTAMQKVLSVAPATSFPPLRVYWSPKNAPTGGAATAADLASGQIGTTFFINRSTGREIYVLGKEDADTDEFDAPVIAHEWGHYYQSSFSRDDSAGGDHSGNDRVDRRLAFSEGWGNAWSGIALGRSTYMDSSGPGQADGQPLDLTVGPASNPGWYRETSIESIFWNLNRQVGFKPINDAMTSLQFRSAAPVTSIHLFAAAFNAVAPGNAAALKSLLAGQGITSTDAYGAGESNNDSAAATPVPNVLPMYRPLAVGVLANNIACISNVAGTGNKLGNISYLSFSVLASRDYTIQVTSGGAPGAPDFDLFKAGLVARSGNKVSLGAGDYVLAVRDTAFIPDPNNPPPPRCFSVLVQ